MILTLCQNVPAPPLSKIMLSYQLMVDAFTVHVFVGFKLPLDTGAHPSDTPPMAQSFRVLMIVGGDAILWEGGCSTWWN